MSRAAWKWSAAGGLAIVVVATALFWPKRSVNTSSLPEVAATPAADARSDVPPQGLPHSQGKAPLQEEQLPDVLRDEISPDSQAVARLGVDLGDINWRSRFDYLDHRQYPPVYDDLKSLAENGDPDAAYFLSQTLQFCDQSGPPPMSESEFAEELRMIREAYLVPQYHNGERRIVDIAETNMSTGAAAAVAQLKYDKCKDMPMERRGEADQWKDFAILNGSPVAKSVFAWELSQMDDPSALMDMWKEGDPMALNSLSGFFRKQYEAGTDPAGRMKSFAYWLAFRELYYASRQAAGPDMKPFFDGIEISAQGRRKQLLPGQIAEAEELAEEILRNLPAGCCVSLDVRVLRQ